MRRRDSSGWDDCREAGCVDEAGPLLVVELKERFERSVSWTPGAEGADGARAVLFGCAAAGTMRRDC